MTGSRTTAHRQIVEVTLDHLYIPIPVEIEYVVDRETSWGADRDGRQGAVRTEVLVLDASICPGRLQVGDLTSEDVEEVLAIAKYRVGGL